MALGRGQRAVMIGVGAIEPLQRMLAELRTRDEALLAEHPHRHAGTGAAAMATHPVIARAVRAVHARGRRTAGTVGHALAASGLALPPGLAHLLTGDAAIVIGIDPVEDAIGYRRAAPVAHCLALLASEAAVMISIEPGEALVGPLDHLRAGDLGLRTGARNFPRNALRGSDAGSEQRGPGQKAYVNHKSPSLRA